MARAGSTPHLPSAGRVMLVGGTPPAAVDVAAGAPLLVDVEFRGRALYALSQGIFPANGMPADPAMHDTGALLRVRFDGTLHAVVSGLDQPTSVEFIGSTAYVVTLSGEIWTIDVD